MLKIIHLCFSIVFLALFEGIKNALRMCTKVSSSQTFVSRFVAEGNKILSKRRNPDGVCNMGVPFLDIVKGGLVLLIRYFDFRVDFHDGVSVT